MRFDTANIIARDLIRKLEPHCVNGKCLVAGSLRRVKGEIGDIEIIAQAKKIILGGNTLFEATPDIIKVDPAFVRAVKELGEIIAGNPATDRMVKVNISHVYGKIKLDLFLPQEHDFARQFCIRTGSKDFAFKVIAVAWRRLGWVGTDNGLRLASECVNINEGRLDSQGIRMKPRWICNAEKPTLPPVWRDEKSFFEWLQIPYTEPQFRNI